MENMQSCKPVIAHINQSFFAGHETFIYNYISNFKHFHPICLGWKILNLEQFPFPKKDLYDISLKWHIFEWVYDLIMRDFFMKDPQAEKEAERIIEKRRFRLIHAHFGFNGYFALAIKRKLRIPLITTFYGCDISSYPKKKKWNLKFKILFHEGDFFLVEGSYMKSLLKDLGCPEEKIHIQRIAIPLDKIRFKHRKAKKRGEKVILIFSGRLEEKKGLLYALKAIEKVRGKYKNFEFRIIGDGSLKPMIEEFIKTHHMEYYVYMLGFLNYDNYLKEMQKADIFIHPSVTASNGDMEGGAPTTILEAQAMGMPVISTYHADIPNIVVPGKSALLSNEKDYLEISWNIIYLLENQEIWDRMGHIGREFVETYHNVKKEVDALEDKYGLLLQ